MNKLFEQELPEEERIQSLISAYNVGAKVEDTSEDMIFEDASKFEKRFDSSKKVNAILQDIQKYINRELNE
jgi:hypothetical protein